jgi:hypothetical protein
MGPAHLAGRQVAVRMLLFHDSWDWPILQADEWLQELFYFFLFHDPWDRPLLQADEWL